MKSCRLKPILSLADGAQWDSLVGNLLITLPDAAVKMVAACETILRGVSAVGGLLSHAGPEVEDGAVSAESVEALGGLVAELGEVAAMLLTLSANCRNGVMMLRP